MSLARRRTPITCRRCPVESVGDTLLEISEPTCYEYFVDFREHISFSIREEGARMADKIQVSPILYDVGATIPGLQEEIVPKPTL